MRKLGLGEVKQLAQRHTVSYWCSQDLNSTFCLQGQRASSWAQSIRWGLGPWTSPNPTIPGSRKTQQASNTTERRLQVCLWESRKGDVLCDWKVRVHYGISSSFKLKEWDLNPYRTEEETKSLLQPPPSPHLVLGIGRCGPWEEGRKEPKGWVIYLSGSCLVLSLNSYLTWNAQWAFCWKDLFLSSISKQGTNQEFKKCFSKMYLGIGGNGVGYVQVLPVIFATFS